MMTEKTLRKNKLSKIKRYNAKKFKELNKKNNKQVLESEFMTTMSDAKNILEIDDLHTYFYTDIGTVRAVDGATIHIPYGKTVGVVGESGCGKSVTSLSVLRLLQEPQGQIASGSIRFNHASKNRAVDLTKMPLDVMNEIRGNDISMIFQEPMTTLNPVFAIGSQIDEVIFYHNKENLHKKEIASRSIELLKMVGIANAEGVYKMYPHELSGGMRQRVVIAIALACNPQLIIADEPTTALDVTIQAQILDLLQDLKRSIKASIMLITHDLGVVAKMADYVVVMYAGRVIEEGDVSEIFHNPSHPYTKGLMQSRPSSFGDGDRLYSIRGNVPNPIDLPNYCYFRNRCDSCVKACGSQYPPMFSLSDTHKVACYMYLGAVKGGSGQ